MHDDLRSGSFRFGRSLYFGDYKRVTGRVSCHEVCDHPPRLTTASTRLVECTHHDKSKPTHQIHDIWCSGNSNSYASKKILTANAGL
jgi:hypothetical protein